jgi:hypothetical protein
MPNKEPPKPVTLPDSPAPAPVPAPASAPAPAPASPPPPSMLKRITSGKLKGTGHFRSLSTSARSSPKEQAILSEEDVRALFSGAPQFTVDTVRGRREAKAHFPWDEEPSAGYISDCPPLAHPAFYAATLEPIQLNSSSSIARRDPNVDFDVGTVELPSMKYSQGLELGSVGLRHFLEIAIADSSLTDEEDEKAKNGLSEAARTRELLHSSPEKLGIRRFDSALIYDRLIELTDLYRPTRESGPRTTILDASSPGELYAILFGKFLTPPRFDPDTGDPTGLKVQIETLLKVLKLKGIWYNFSLVEWRIRLGQLLWTSTEPTLSEEEGLNEPGLDWNGRDLLLLQILLSCELYLRLEAVFSMSSVEVADQLNLTSEEVEHFNATRTRKIDWDLVLARRFLQEIQVVAEAMTTSLSESKKRNLYSSMSSELEEHPPLAPGIIIMPRNQSRQLTGLAFFAAAIDWPNIDSVFGDLSQKLDLPDIGSASARDSLGAPTNKAGPSIYATPLNTPPSGSARSSYFSSTYPSRPLFSRSSTQRSVLLRPSSAGQDLNASSTTPSIGGWLSRAYLTGLTLPGEAICHLLISTLLENDSLAITALGDSASLYGGFAYAACSWWSKTCIVGKVLAASVEAKECMGWIMTKCVPVDFEEAWVDLSCNMIPIKNRLEDDEVALASNFIKGKGSPVGSKVGEFRVPVEEMKQRHHARDAEIRFLGLFLEATKEVHFKEPSRTDVLTEPAVATGAEGDSYANDLYAATLRFSVPPTSPDEEINPDLVDHGDAEDPVTDRSDPQVHTLHLRHDIQFVSAFPCSTPPASKVPFLKLPESVSAQASNGAESSNNLTAHPLHSSHTYHAVSVSTLVDPDSDATIIGAVMTQGKDEILVIDATSSADAAMLSRAWCAEKGFHALIARRPRTCLSCAIREASGLGIRVIIRV